MEKSVENILSEVEQSLSDPSIQQSVNDETLFVRFKDPKLRENLQMILKDSLLETSRCSQRLEIPRHEKSASKDESLHRDSFVNEAHDHAHDNFNVVSKSPQQVHGEGDASGFVAIRLDESEEEKDQKNISGVILNRTFDSATAPIFKITQSTPNGKSANQNDEINKISPPKDQNSEAISKPEKRTGSIQPGPNPKRVHREISETLGKTLEDPPTNSPPIDAFTEETEPQGVQNNPSLVGEQPSNQELLASPPTVSKDLIVCFKVNDCHPTRDQMLFFTRKCERLAREHASFAPLEELIQQEWRHFGEKRLICTEKQVTILKELPTLSYFKAWRIETLSTRPKLCYFEAIVKSRVKPFPRGDELVQQYKRNNPRWQSSELGVMVRHALLNLGARVRYSPGEDRGSVTSFS